MYLYPDLYLTLLQLTIILKPDRPDNRPKLIPFTQLLQLVWDSPFHKKETFSNTVPKS